MKMTTAIFDLDGTLLNSLGDLCDSVTYAVEKHGFPPVSMEQTRIRIGNGVRKLVERSIPEREPHGRDDRHLSGGFPRVLRRAHDEPHASV